MFSSVMVPWPRRFLKARCSLSDRFFKHGIVHISNNRLVFPGQIFIEQGDQFFAGDAGYRPEVAAGTKDLTWI
jgi:hypothetical protein